MTASRINQFDSVRLALQPMFGVNSKRLDSTTSRQYVGADGEKDSYRLGFAGTLTVKYQSRFKFWIVSVGTTAAGSLSGITLRSPCLTAPTMSPRGTHDACQRDASAAGARAVVAAHRVGLCGTRPACDGCRRRWPGSWSTSQRCLARSGSLSFSRAAPSPARKSAGPAIPKKRPGGRRPLGGLLVNNLADLGRAALLARAVVWVAIGRGNAVDDLVERSAGDLERADMGFQRCVLVVDVGQNRFIVRAP